MNSLIFPSLDFIAGFFSTGATFMWVKQKNVKVPVFQIKMQISDRDLLETIKLKLGLKEKIYEYKYKNTNYLLLLARKRSTIENIIIPTFDGRLFGNKAIQFENWKNKYYQEKLNFVYKHYR